MTMTARDAVVVEKVAMAIFQAEPDNAGRLWNGYRDPSSVRNRYRDLAVAAIEALRADLT